MKAILNQDIAVAEPSLASLMPLLLASYSQGEDSSGLHASLAATDVDRNFTQQIFNQIVVKFRTEGTEQFSVLWINRMTNNSIALHKFRKGAYVVELGAPSGVLEAINFKSIEPATSFALLNTDVERMDDETAIKARRSFMGYIIAHEPRARDAGKFPKGCWQLNRLRSKDIKFTAEDGSEYTGRLRFIAPGGQKVLVTNIDAEGKSQKHLIPTTNVWM